MGAQKGVSVASGPVVWWLLPTATKSCWVVFSVKTVQEFPEVVFFCFGIRVWVHQSVSWLVQQGTETFHTGTSLDSVIVLVELGESLLHEWYPPGAIVRSVRSVGNEVVWYSGSILVRWLSGW
jgi:hypothetical protein